jgi:hypothetical protein
MPHSSKCTNYVLYISGIECSSPNWPASVANVFCIVGEKKGGIAFWNLHNAPHIPCKESGIAFLTMLYYFGAYSLILGQEELMLTTVALPAYLPTSLLGEPSPYSAAHRSTL